MLISISQRRDRQVVLGSGTVGDNLRHRGVDLLGSPVAQLAEDVLVTVPGLPHQRLDGGILGLGAVPVSQLSLERLVLNSNRFGNPRWGSCAIRG